MAHREPKRVFAVAGEHSGDLLGGKLIRALKQHSATELEFLGVGGDTMVTEGLRSIFPMTDVAVMGPAAILARLPKLVRRVYETADAAVAFAPDLLIVIDSPEFTHPIAKRIRSRMPNVPIVDYVSPSVWAWRPGRARKMVPYVDRLLALLPFEPEVHERLGGPPCIYVGHPLIEKAEWIDGLDAASLAKRLDLTPGLPILVVLPGSRVSEVARLMEPFGEAIRLIRQKAGPIEIIVPAVASVRKPIEDRLVFWPQQPYLVQGEEDKFKAFKLANAALAASGTVTLELAVAGTPMAVAYRVDALSGRLRFLIKVPSIVLANLVAGTNAFPEFVQEDCTPQNLADAIYPLLCDSPQRRAQQDALITIRSRMTLAGLTPSDAAAQAVLPYLEGGRKGWPAQRSDRRRKRSAVG